MNTVSLFGIALCTLFMSAVIKEVRKDHVLYLTLAVCLLFFTVFLGHITPVVEYIRTLASSVTGDQYIVTMLKALGIAYLTEITGEICKSCGEPSLTGYVETIGKAEILVLCLPLIQKLTDTALSYI